MTTPILGMTELVASQTQPHVPINTALRVLEANAQISVVAIENTPPVSPVEGDRYIVGTTPTGEWVGHDDQLATLIGGGWTYNTPLDGWIAYSVAAAQFYFYDSTLPAWTFLISRGVQLVEQSVDLTLMSVHNGAKIVVPEVSPGITITLPTYGSSPLTSDFTTTIVNLGSNLLTVEMEVASPQDLLFLYPNGSITGFTIAQYGSATLTKVSTTEWLVIGAGLSAL